MQQLPTCQDKIRIKKLEGPDQFADTCRDECGINFLILFEIQKPSLYCYNIICDVLLKIIMLITINAQFCLNKSVHTKNI